MATKGNKAKGPKQSARAATTRRTWIIGAGAALVLLAAVLFFVLGGREPAEGYYRFTSLGEVSRLIQSGEPVLVYFHSPT
ncbi:MAG: hypothetical protein C0P61_002415 [Bacillota bacterium]|nr:hypothetical protein [Bacillota bacterium]REJ36702.1 MAG: hypothetical protein DIU82_03490 [Bacillota bacterium]